MAVGLISMLALLLACRGAPLGVPAADDYDYLDALLRPVDPFGAMGSIWYWRRCIRPYDSRAKRSPNDSLTLSATPTWILSAIPPDA